MLGALDEPRPDQGAGAAAQRVAGYEIVRKLGVGGTAEVFLARQKEPIEREVALKLIRPGMDSERVVARFAAEREVLAKLRHPNIATIHDAGQTDAGRPFFVLEYVDGEPITEFVERERFTLQRRLQLFIQVCEAVTHAHQRGVVHRDLKPSNLLVDGSGQVKVIDFGIARALEDGFGEHTLYMTREGEMIGTPAYMSPEQALGQAAEIDTRSDVFSLGAILYELLTGRLPVDLGQLRAASPLELQRLLTETQFQRPSLRATTTHVSVGAIRGDLDWIVMKALERDKERRYGSVAALAEDIRRHLADEPVSAGPPTVAYRLRKFVRRNRAVAAGSAIAAGALLAGSGISITQAMRAGTAEDRAVAAARIAETERNISDAINRFLLEDLLGADLRFSTNPDVTLRELVDVAAGKTQERFGTQPEVAQEIEMAIGDLYRALGDYERAADCYSRSSDHLRSLPRGASRDGRELQLLRRRALNAIRQGRMEEVRHHWDAWETLAARTDVPPEQVLESRMLSLQVMMYDGKVSEAIAEMRALLPEFEKHFGVDHASTLTLKLNLGRDLVRHAGDPAAGVPLMEEYVEWIRPMGRSMVLAETLSDLGLAYARQGLHDEAIETFEEAVEIQDELLDPDHPSRISLRNQLGVSYRLMGRNRLAEATFREVFEMGTRSGGELSIDALVAGQNYGAEIFRSEPEKAIPVFESVLAGLERLGTDYGSLRLHASYRLAVAMWLTGQRDAAIARLKDEVASGIQKSGESHPDVLAIQKVIVELELQRKRERALPHARAALSAPIPDDEALRSRASGTIGGLLAMLDLSFGDQPELLVDLYLTALGSGHVGNQVWRGLGEALHGRYRSSADLRDLRLAATCLLRAGGANNATGVEIVSEWIDKDHLAEGLRAPKFLVGPQSVWHYQDATPLDPAWRSRGFDAESWPRGRGKFGYGDGDEDTLLRGEEGLGKKTMSACFRLKMRVGDDYERPLVATVAFDDGAVVYVNGIEVFRGLMPAGEPGPETAAVGPKLHESLHHGFAIAPEHFPPDEFVVIAAQVHQAPHDTEDLSFAFSLAEPLPPFDAVLERLPLEELKAFFGQAVDALTQGG